MKNQSFIFNTIPSWIVISMPALLISGPFLSDLGLSFVALLFLINSVKNKLKKNEANVEKINNKINNKVINTILSVSGINMKNFQPVPNVKGVSAFGGYSYTAVKPIGLRMVGEIAMAFPKVEISGVGGINETDVALAATNEAMIIGFNVRADNAAKSLSEKESIEILYYSIIYDLIDGIKTSVEGHLAPEVREQILGTAEVKDIFKSPKFGQIAGSIVIEGTIKRNKPIRVLRDDIVIFEGELDSLKRFKDDASEVPMGTECGIGVANYRDVKVGDKIEVFDRIEVKRTLD